MEVWQGSEYASELASKSVWIFKSVWILKVTDNLLLGKTKKKEPNELQDSSTKMLLLIHISSHVAQLNVS